MNPKIKYVNFNFYYGPSHALRNVNLEIADRKVTALIGPSGCGKSTLLRACNRMYELYQTHRAEGQIQFNGENILSPDQDVIKLRSKIGMVFQKQTPFPTSMAENVAFGVKLYEKLSSQDLEERIEGALKKAALWNEVKDKLKESGMSLSGGQQQRLCIARAIAMKPEVLLLDEPTSALDPISTAKIEELFFHLKEDCCLLVVTHNMQQAARASDYTGFMNMGTLIEFNRSNKIFTNPEQKLTEDYISGRFG